MRHDLFRSFLAAALTVGAAAASPPQQASTLLVRTGSVELRRDGASRALAPGTWPLFGGDQLVAGKGADALVATAGGNVKLLRAGEPWIAPSAAPAATAGPKRLLGALFAWDPVHDRSLAAARVDSGGHLAAAFPADGEVILDDRPDLIWNEPRGRHRVILRCAGQTVLDTEVAEGHRTRFPAAAPSLPRGALCDWQVLDAEDAGRMDVSRFSVASQAKVADAHRSADRVRAELAAAKASPAMVHLALAGQFLDAGYQHAAVIELLLAAEAAPGDPELAFAIRWWIDR